MKIRTGFVSNSSSSSFCIYGVCLDEGTEEFEDLKMRILKSMKKEELDEVENEFKDLEDSDDECDCDDCDECEDFDYEVLENAVSQLGLSFIADFEVEQIFIGRDYSSLEDDETGKQFKDSTEEKLKELFGKDVSSDCEFICEVIENS